MSMSEKDSLIQQLNLKIEILETKNEKKMSSFDLNIFKDEMLCSACSQLSIAPIALKCGHVQCFQCTRERLQQNVLSCSICNK